MNDLINSILSAEPFDMKELRGHESWKWYGYAGHLVVAHRCAYHLCTRVDRYLISTVGAYFQNPLHNVMTPLGGSSDDFFETYVFKFFGEKNGDPQTDYNEVDSERYSTSRDAEIGHYRFCWKYHEAAK